MTSPLPQSLPSFPPCEPLPISVRGYVPCPPVDPEPPAKKGRPGRGPSEWTLVFDTETTIDPHRCAASVRFRRRLERPSDIGSTAAEIAPPIARYTSSPSDAYGPTREPRITLPVG